MPVATSLQDVHGRAMTSADPLRTQSRVEESWRSDRRSLGQLALTKPAKIADVGTFSSLSSPTSLVLSPGRQQKGVDEKLGSAGKEGKPRRKKRRNQISANLSGTRYEIIRTMVKKCGFVISNEDDLNSFLLWNDSFVSTDRISELKPYQKINHFPGMGEVCRKDCLARNISKMVRYHADDYNFFPKTWILPAEYTTFQNYARDLKKKKKTKTFIVKPANGAMGNGITLLRNADKLPSQDHMIVQEYIEKPLLIDGYKCDMRIYVLVMSCDPLKVFLYEDGLLRMSTEKYVHPSDANIDHLYMHLTNYSVNKRSEQYDRASGDDVGSKRSLRHLAAYLRQHDVDAADVWRRVTDVVVKSLIVALPHVLHAYRMCRPGRPADSVCFELLGFDIMLDRKLRPWLLEINRSPSFGTDEQLDYEIKSGVVEDTLRLLNIRSSDKRKNIAAQKAQTQKRLLKPTKRQESNGDLNRTKQSVEKKKEELRELLARVRRETAQDDYESRHCGRFRRIFPSDDPLLQERYTSLLADAFRVFLSGRSSSLQRQIERSYDGQPKEEDILDMIAQCDEESEGKPIFSMRLNRSPKPLSSMPTILRTQCKDEMQDEDADDSEVSASEESVHGSPKSSRRNRSNVSLRASRSNQSQYSSCKPNGLSMLDESLEHESLERELEAERQQQLLRETLDALNEMRIKFPGKTQEQAELLLDTLNQNWAHHKPRVASYWLVKLDSTKRRKVIDIVRSNVRCATQRVWQCADIDKLPIYRIFCRVFNRFLWSHGQGLWNCFQNSGDAWESACSRGAGVLGTYERACCQRIVQLCRDCLLIVYQFAIDARESKEAKDSKVAKSFNTAADMERTASRLSGVPSSSVGSWSLQSNLLSQRMARLYQSRPQSSN